MKLESFTRSFFHITAGLLLAAATFYYVLLTIDMLFPPPFQCPNDEKHKLVSIVHDSKGQTSCIYAEAFPQGTFRKKFGRNYQPM